MHPAEIALNELNPRPAGDPYYVPWWAKPPHGVKMNTSYTTKSGVTVSGGRVTGRVKTSVPAVEPKATKVPSSPSEPPSVLCDRYGLPHSLYLDAPNKGVGVMRVRNAIKKMNLE